MVDLLKHRGPDDSGTFSDDGIGLGACRLKIIDLTQNGHQPMSNEEHSVWVVYNGEISNFKELRRSLEGLGHRFISESDTEVIVHGYQEWGADVSQHLDGMWAFAVYDRPRQQVVLSRDRTGIKPLYYRIEGEAFRFGSEIKALLKGDSLPELDLAGVAELVTYGFNPSRSTAFRSVKKLLRGETLTYDLRGRSLRIRKYWNGIAPGGYGIDLHQLEKLLQTAVDRNLISDVPVGCYVSGGIDSSLVSILYSRLYSSTLETFTVGFGDGEDEHSFGSQIADYLGSRHLTVDVSDHVAVTSLDSVLPTFDFGITDPALLPLTILAAQAKKRVTVILAGEGGDEVFGGYDHHRAFGALRRWRLDGAIRTIPYPNNLNGWSASRFGRLMKFWGAAHSVSPARMALHVATSVPLSTARRIVPGLDVEHTVRSMEADVDCATMAASPNLPLLMDQAWLLPENLNYKSDKSSSSAGLEERVPLQDWHLMEFSNRLDVRVKVGLTHGKLPLRNLLHRDIPDLSRRTKHGFGTPIRRWIRGEMSSDLEESVNRLVQEKYVDGARVYPIFARSRTTQISDGELRFLWNLLVVGKSLRCFGY